MVVQLRICTEGIIGDHKSPMFNRSSTSSFYRADVVVLVCVRSPNEYKSLILPVKIAERASQMNLDREYRTKKKDGTSKRPYSVWVSLNDAPKRWDPRRVELLKEEQKFLKPYEDNWTDAFV